MVIELFGIPGSGKSTLAAAAAKKVEFATRGDISCQWARRSALEKFAALAVWHARPFRSVLVLQFAIAMRLTSMQGWKRLSKILAKSRRLRSANAKVLLDQGLLQELWSILYASRKTTIDPGLAVPLVRLLYEGMDARLIYVEIDPAIAAARIARRRHGNSALDGLDNNEIEERLVLAHPLPTALVAAAEQAGITVLRVDGAGPTEAIAEAVAATFRR